jgi:hypothetical protein
MREVKNGRTAVGLEASLTKSETPHPILTNKLGMGVYNCNSSYMGGRGRRITV